MKIVFSDECNQDFNNISMEQGIGIALGNFDGVHLAHMELIKRVIDRSRMEKLQSMVYTFSNHPENIISGRTVTPLITSNEAKVKILEKTGLDYLYFQKFDKDFMKMKPETFVRDVLVQKFNMKLAVVGFDYRFGYKGTGDIELLKRLENQYGFKVEVIQPVKIGNIVVGSSLIRNLIRQGNVELAHQYMDRYYCISGKVVQGKRLGNKLGFPTINIIPQDDIILPPNGVYVTRTCVKCKIYESITNVGNNPTVENAPTRVETHLLDFEGDLYDADAEVQFIARVRSEKKFGSVEELSEQVQKDRMYARKFFANETIYNKMNIC